MGILGQAAEETLQLPGFMEAASRVRPANLAARQLQTLSDELTAIVEKASGLVAGHSHSELTCSPKPGSWSAAQCLDHLAQTTSAFLPSITSAVGRAPRLGRNRTLKTGALTRLLIRNLEPPYRLHFKVLAALAPQQQEFASARAAFVESQVRLQETIRSAASLAIDQVKIESPVYARVSYNVYGALRMLAAHQRRHIWQVEQILKALDRGVAGTAA
jgi:hypothetical protein